MRALPVVLVSLFLSAACADNGGASSLGGAGAGETREDAAAGQDGGVAEPPETVAEGSDAVGDVAGGGLEDGQADGVAATDGDGADALPEVDPCADLDCGGHGTCFADVSGPVCLCEAGWVVSAPPEGGTTCVSACEQANPCTEPGRTQCVQEASDPSGILCLCDAGHVEEGDRCVPTDCSEDSARAFVTVYDQTPLPTVTTPIQNGFDPLLRGDSVRVQVAFTRSVGPRTHHLVITHDNLAIVAESVALDGVSAVPVVLDARRLEVALPAEATAGRLTFDATIPVAAPGLLALEARVRSAAGCAVPGSGSGARIQLTGQVNAKHNACNDLGSLRSLQISTGVPDKDTSVYAERNGSFPDLADRYKILTQMTLCLARPAGVTVSFAGSADGTRPWTIDNHLLVEVFSTEPSQAGAQRVSAWVTTSANGNVPGSFPNGERIRLMNQGSLPGDYTGSITPSFFSFPAGVVQLDRVLPEGTPVWLRITGLDEGVAGHLSHLFLTASAPGEFVPECRSGRDCPREEASGMYAPRAGCVGGRCVGPVCADQSACPLGQACLGGFCSDGCSATAPCPTGQTCASGQCVDVAAGGCRTYEDCPEGAVCFFGRCEAGCFHPVRQNPTYANNHATSVCKLTPAACPRCGTAAGRCWNNYCRDCEIDAHCSPSQRCVSDRCVAR
jgi:hypothetical protein